MEALYILGAVLIALGAILIIVGYAIRKKHTAAAWILMGVGLVCLIVAIIVIQHQFNSVPETAKIW